MHAAFDAELLVLNFNGRALLERCLSSVCEAAQASRYRCRVRVIDNSSTDDSLDLLERRFAHLGVLTCPNRGLASFNLAAAQSRAPVVVLLNNDLVVRRDFVDPLLAPLLASRERDENLWATVPRLWREDGQTYEGQRTAVAWRWGLVQATSHFPGYSAGVASAGPTAAAGAALAVDREKFLSLGGFDRRYLPGVIEDLDLGYRGHCRGWRMAYVPQSQAVHLGRATFGPQFGDAGCRYLALRNTLLFQWTHLRRPSHVARQSAGLAARALRELAAAPFRPAGNRWQFLRALAGAWKLWRQHGSAPRIPGNALAERSFFSRFSPQSMCRPAAATPGRLGAAGAEPAEASWTSRGAANGQLSLGKA